ncbi:MAG: hypothetical protein M1834_007940 [Cirrosporium novae-zelandiae]|nr:MAG: hypothetical protein M1834_007940 [Cirrosporium novae-zelandiae]
MHSSFLLIRTITRPTCNVLSSIGVSSSVFSCRHASLNSAISKGLRRESQGPRGKRPRNRWEGRGHQKSKLGREVRLQEEYRAATPIRQERRQTNTFRESRGEKPGWSSVNPTLRFEGRRSHQDEDREMSNEERKRKVREKYDAKAQRRLERRQTELIRKHSGEEPELSLETPTERHDQESERPSSVPSVSHKYPSSIEYTTSASEFLYGTSAVIAALRSRRRKLYKLYMYKPGLRSVEHMRVQKLAHAAGVPIKHIGGPDVRLLDTMSQGRPHNGYVLETSPCPKLPVTSLKSVDLNEKHFQVQLEYQSEEDLAVNGNDPNILSLCLSSGRFPFLVMLYNILDPGNLGAIIRSAYFFGADAVVMVGRNCAPLSPVSLKASAGAIEMIPIITVDRVETFMKHSQMAGWRFYAAHVPNGPSSKLPETISTFGIQDKLTQAPSVLLLGNEGQGLPRHLLRDVNNLITIQGNRAGEGGIDSLNVSVAAGILCELFLRHTDKAKAKKVVSGQQKVFSL